MKRIYITGGIGSGKSTATETFKENGFSVISADKLAEEILQEHVIEIMSMFAIHQLEFTDMKKELSSKVFNSSEKKKILEKFILPKITEKIENEAKQYEAYKIPFVIEAPTYYEVRNMKKGDNDIVILITTERDTKVKRIKERNTHLSIEDINKRIDSQIDDGEKEHLSDYVVKNDDLDIFKAEIHVIAITHKMD